MVFSLFKHPPKPIVLQNVKKTKMKSIGLFLLVLVLLEGICCEGCWKEERDALLVLKSHIGDIISLKSWEDDTDCCLWERVECNSTTRRVTELHLYQRDGSSPIPWHLNFSDFIAFKDLKTLDLHWNKILGCVETHQGYFSNKFYINYYYIVCVNHFHYTIYLRILQG